MTVAVVIPAFNEAETVAAVVRPCVEARLATHVIVVDDGSADGTAEAARAAGADVLVQKNSGKAKAIDNAIARIRDPFMVMLDADLVDLCSDHVDALVDPVATRAFDVAIGTVGRGDPDTRRPLDHTLSGQRCFPTRLWTVMRSVYPDIVNMRFGIEIGLNHVIHQLRLRRTIVPLEGVWDPFKRDKYGRVLGALRRGQMWAEILRTKQYLARSPMTRARLDRSLLGLPQGSTP